MRAHEGVGAPHARNSGLQLHALRLSEQWQRNRAAEMVPEHVPPRGVTNTRSGDVTETTRHFRPGLPCYKRLGAGSGLHGL